MINDATCIDNNGDYVNTFTPNGDGQNDVLILPQFPKCKIGHSDFKVFNRWGAPVLSKANYDNNWDGKNDNGEELPGGTYYYVLNLKTTDGKSFVIKNFVELIR
jgi:gliding motility-associated-like protein